ncbi:cysteine synthase [Desulfocurvus vexinensis]|uniref:cysteine synthase n=1 Tax=Desulfocurvus vexinensis TaxID=399548 RepID=UPI00048EC603|nr:cysteine synthase [Desulfocurvus vexinensis]
MIYSSVLELSGNTPLVALSRIGAGNGVRILAKIESGNPGGSIKDRVALAMIRAAEASGELTPDKTIIEATSGNTGIGLAMVCAVRGYRLKLLMPDTASQERRRIMRAYGAEIVLTEGRLGTDGAIEEAYRLAREEPQRYVLMDQFNNPASIQAHYEGTGREIWEQTGGEVTHVVVALGTSGTAMGCVKRLKECSRQVEVVAVEPYPRHKIQGLKNMQESYPPGIFNKHLLDRIVRVEDEAAFAMCRRLAREEGILAGMSSGAALAGALKIAAELDQGLVVVIFPDGGERYLSTPLFAPPAERGPHLRCVAGGEVRLAPQGRPMGLYTVGPSLDRWDDPEFWRRLVLLDVLGRSLEADGGQVRLGAGLADMDDRTLAGARAAGMRRAAFAAGVRTAMLARAADLGLAGRVELPLAGECAEACTALAERLLSRGLAYEKLRSVYFDVLRDPDYGRMGQMDMDHLSLGKTVDLADYVKANPQDFTLLKRATLQDIKEGEFWPTRWGNVRPSWFMQMAVAALAAGPGPAVFWGGEAHRFPHLENLRAIWASGADCAPLAWVVSQPVGGPEGGAEGGIGAASLGALLERGTPAAALRLWLLSASYHKPLDFSRATLDMWARNQRTVQDLAALLAALPGDAPGEPGPAVAQLLVEVKGALREALDQDLALYAFWPVLLRFCREVKKLAAAGRLAPAEAAACRARLDELDARLGILDRAALPLAPQQWPAEAADMVARREAARAARDYAGADALRDGLAALGYTVEDAPGGPRLYAAPRARG